MELIELIETLNTAHGPSGDEGGVRAVMEHLAKPYADEMTADTLGNLIVRKKGSGPKVMFAAHMDSIGFIVTHIEKEGFLRVGRLGGVSPKEVLYTPVRFKNGLRGVVVPEEKADFGKLKLDECFLDIGARSEEEAKKLVRVGDTAVYDTAVFTNGGGSQVFSPYLDNRISCAILLSVLERLPAHCPNDLYFVFTVQEEVGLRGSRTAAFGVDPDYGVAVDVTDVDDTPALKSPAPPSWGRARPSRSWIPPSSVTQPWWPSWRSWPGRGTSPFSGTSCAPAAPTRAPSTSPGPGCAPAASPCPAGTSIPPPRRWT